MKFSGLLTNSTGIAFLAGSLLLLPLSVQAQDHAPSPDEYAAQLAAQNGQNGAHANQYNQNNQYAQDPNAGPQYGAPQNGAPQGISQAPPAIPDYDQPAAPGDGYIWTPGYWAWGQDGYEWVNGAWVAAPYSGALWTPGYWGYGGDGYFWNTGYWGPYVGYYGGINYGFGYFGIGFYGGYWGGGRFWYNRAYCNIGIGRGFNAYNRPFSGYSGRPGGSSFVRGNGYGGNHVAAGGGTAFRGSSINGNVRSNGFAEGNNRAAATNSAARSYNGGNYAGAARSYSAPQAQSHASYSGGAPAGGGGGGFHGGGGAPAGGGGGSHGGGGGHR
jgi:hypothetical protein